MLKHDLLVLDLELSGLDPLKHEVIQISAVLLDKKTLKEKAFFNAYIKPTNFKNRSKEADKIHGLTEEFLNKNGRKIKSVLTEFKKTFAEKCLLAAWGGYTDGMFLQIAYQQANIKNTFDYHILNIWDLAYLHYCKSGMKKNPKKFAGFELGDMVKHFNITWDGNAHDALADARAEAEVLRHLLK